MSEQTTGFAPAAPATVIFDMGGVLFHWQPLDLLQQVLAPHAPHTAAAQALAQRIFQPLDPQSDWAQFDMGTIEPGPLATRIAARTGLPRADIVRLIDALAPHMAVKHDTVALLQELKAHGHRLLYLSNMPRGLAQWIAQDHPFFACFEAGVFSAHVQQVKPNADIFETTSARFGLAGQAPIFIDDMAYNIAAAQAQGWRGICFESAAQARKQLSLWGLLPLQ